MKNTILLITLLSACCVAMAADTGSKAAKSAETAPHAGMTTQSSSAMPLGHPDSIPADTNLVNSGKVLDVIDSPMYTYVQVASDKGTVWLAAYKTEIAKGAKVAFSNGVVMNNFHSNSINRTFDMIVFVDALQVVK